MWNIDKANVRDLTFEDMTPTEVFYDFDGPRIFTFTVGSETYFACWSDENSQQQITRYLVVSTSPSEIEHLKAGAISLDRVLDKIFLWAVDRNFANQVVDVNCLIGGIATVPEGFKPEKGTPLWDHLEAEGQSRTLDLALEIKRLTSSFVISQRAEELLKVSSKSHNQQRLDELKDNFQRSIIRHISRTAIRQTFETKSSALYAISGDDVVASAQMPSPSPSSKKTDLYQKKLDYQAIRMSH